MQLQSLLASLCLATVLEATPVGHKGNTYHEIVHFKRDVVLSARDIELADLHNVNLTEMWKHSVVKRHDGDDVTIWVDNSFKETYGPEDSLAKRQSARLWPGAHHWEGPGFRNCRFHARRDITSATSPFTGGVLAIRDWARSRSGRFLIGTHPDDGTKWGPGAGGWGWRTVLIGGSNSGRNARYRMAIKDPRHYYFSWVDNLDIVEDCNWTHDRRRQFSGRWRAASEGEQTCGLPGGPGVRQEFQIVSFDERV